MLAHQYVDIVTFRSLCFRDDSDLETFWLSQNTDVSGNKEETEEAASFLPFSHCSE